MRVQRVKKHLRRLSEMLIKLFGNFHDERGEGGNRVFLLQGCTVLDQVAKSLGELLEVWQQLLLSRVFTIVGHRTAHVSGDARNRIVQCRQQGGEDFGAKFSLELRLHVVGHLADAMNGGVADLRVRVLQVLDDHTKHGSDDFDVVDVLADLREGHQRGVLVPPIGLICHQRLHDLAEVRQADLVADGTDDVVDAALAKVEVIGLSAVLAGSLFLEAFFWVCPLLFNVFIDLNHELENELK